MLTGYYQKKRKASKKTRERYQNLSEENENKKHYAYACERYRNLPEDEKQRLVEYIKNFLNTKNKDCLHQVTP